MVAAKLQEEQDAGLAVTVLSESEGLQYKDKPVQPHAGVAAQATSAAEAVAMARVVLADHHTPLAPF